MRCLHPQNEDITCVCDITAHIRRCRNFLD